LKQGCQIHIYFHTQFPLWVPFGGALEWKMLCFVAIWNM
jgi:hypothetical protein